MASTKWVSHLPCGESTKLSQLNSSVCVFLMLHGFFVAIKHLEHLVGFALQKFLPVAAMNQLYVLCINTHGPCMFLMVIRLMYGKLKILVNSTLR